MGTQNPNVNGIDKTTVIYVANKDGNGGNNVNITSRADGTILITNPDGSTQALKVGDKGVLDLNEMPYVVNPDGSLTLTNPDKTTTTVDPKNGISGGVTNGSVEGTVKTTAIFIPYNNVKQYTPSNNPESLDLTKTVTENIIYQTADGTHLDQDNGIQNVAFYRTATTKEDGSSDMDYSDWTTNPSGISEKNTDNSDDKKKQLLTKCLITL